MCNIITRREVRRTLRLTWYLTAGVRRELCCRWTVAEALFSTELNGRLGARNQPVTKACDTEPIADCA
jgi:hypothetical protein